MALTVGHVTDPDGRVRNHVEIARRNLKNGSPPTRRKAVRSRRVPVSEKLVRRHRRVPDGTLRLYPHLDPAAPLFAGRFPGEPLCRRQVLRIIRQSAMQCGLSPDLTWASHTCRKTFAKSVYERTGHDIIIITQQALGHRHIQATQQYLLVHLAEVDDAILAAQSQIPLPNDSTDVVSTP